MRSIFILCILVISFSCREQASPNFDWLLGNWERVNEEEGKVTYEFWKKITDKEYKGLSFTLKSNDTIFKENMQLLKIDGKWNLHVLAPKEPHPTVFKVTTMEGNSFIAENKEIEFPTKIAYKQMDTSLNAAVSNKEMKISFEFKKIE
ncbi:DUF6265 family protein [Galbibacter orientalis]|nr:DUF6265 family protein [Galbibacter orientalis]|tara:strand:- start:100 stop:543 length:444 start_codon:yes stop_codon:yes gene_type:complete